MYPVRLLGAGGYDLAEVSSSRLAVEEVRHVGQAEVLPVYGQLGLGRLDLAVGSQQRTPVKVNSLNLLLIMARCSFLYLNVDPLSVRQEYGAATLTRTFGGFVRSS